MNAFPARKTVPTQGRRGDLTDNPLHLLDGGCLDSCAETSEDQGEMVCGQLVRAGEVTEESGTHTCPILATQGYRSLVFSRACHKSGIKSCAIS